MGVVWSLVFFVTQVCFSDLLSHGKKSDVFYSPLLDSFKAFFQMRILFTKSRGNTFSFFVR